MNTEEGVSIPADELALMTEEQASGFIGVTRRAMQAWRVSGKGPNYVRISARCVRYRKVDLVDWSERLLQTSTSQEVSP